MRMYIDDTFTTPVTGVQVIESDSDEISSPWHPPFVYGYTVYQLKQWIFHYPQTKWNTYNITSVERQYLLVVVG